METPKEIVSKEDIAGVEVVREDELADVYELWIDACENLTRPARNSRKTTDVTDRFDLDEYFFASS